MLLKIARCLQGFVSMESTVSCLSLGFGCQFCEIIGLALGHVVLALLQGLLGLVPSLLGDLLCSLLGLPWIGADG